MKLIFLVKAKLIISFGIA